MDQTWVPEFLGWWIFTGVSILIIYYVLMVTSILQMLRAKTNQVLLVFAFLALFPAPPVIIMGIVIMIIWGLHRRA